MSSHAKCCPSDHEQHRSIDPREQTSSLLVDRPGREMSPAQAIQKNVFVLIKYFLIPYGKNRELIYRKKSKTVWSGQNPQGYRNLACYRVCSFPPPPTIQTDSLYGNTAYLHLRSSIRGFCTRCSCSKFLLKSRDSRTIHTQTHIWVKVSTSSGFFLLIIALAEAQKECPCPPAYPPFPTNQQDLHTARAITQFCIRLQSNCRHRYQSFVCLISALLP